MSIRQIGSPSAMRLGFGPFELNVAERSLRKANQVIPLGGRAYDILIALLENAGAVVRKAELIARAWPDVTVGRQPSRPPVGAAQGWAMVSSATSTSRARAKASFIAPVARLPRPHTGGMHPRECQPTARTLVHGRSQRCCPRDQGLLQPDSA